MLKYFNRLFFLNVLLLLLFSACNTQTAEKNTLTSGNLKTQQVIRDTIFNVDPESVLKDFNSWWSYSYTKINLAEDFVGYNVNAEVIEKSEFLKLLQSGKYIPIKTMIKDEVACFKLYSLDKHDNGIANVIKQEANKILAYYQMEGKPLPAFNFKDLNSNIYTPENTKGRIIVLKCWFIHCTACVKEFPELNKIVQQYKDRKDILFISLASDSKQDLEAFLKLKEFNYEVVPDQKIYMNDRLKISGYPAHIIIDKDGNIRIIASKYEDFIQTLIKEASKT